MSLGRGGVTESSRTEEAVDGLKNEGEQGSEMEEQRKAGSRVGFGKGKGERKRRLN